MRSPRWRTVAGAAAVTAALIGSMLAVAHDASAATVDTTAWYELVNRNSGKALDVCSASRSQLHS